MLKFLTNLFDESKKKLDRYQKIVDQINDWEPALKKMSDKKLAQQTKIFKERITTSFVDFKKELAKQDLSVDEKAKRFQAAEAQALDLILPEAFATVREASRRVLGMRHFDVQLLAGIALHYSNITEQKTGEGKTLTVTAPLYLNALLNKGAHLVTVNDYLAEIGVGWMGPIYEFLGLKVGVIIHDQAKLYDSTVDSEERGDERLEHFVAVPRQEVYASDITYGTNNEFGFDYLRDNMVPKLERMVQRVDNSHYFAIVDEADSILIDEARTPLIISAPDMEPTKKYYDYAKMVRSLTKDQDYKIDEKARSVTLTDLGVKRIEAKLGVSNLYEESFDTIHHVEASLKAASIFQRDQEYIVRDNKVIIVDEHTGRLMYGRRYSDGLHQAIEAKEGVPIQQESRTLATISIQNYFRLYQKLSGLTGTAVTEAEEFQKIYHVDVLAIPTNMPMIRKDRPDIVYKTTAAKYSAIAKKVEDINKKGQPILIGTRSIDHNEIIARFLKRKNIQHEVLNAKNHEKEAFIIADAGKKKAITVATNIAGRGVDIVLGGAKPELKDFRQKKQAQTSESAKKNSNSELSSKQVKERQSLLKKYAHLTLPPSVNPANYKLAEYDQALKQWQKGHDEVVALGGLYIIGTERHESRRIDNQLRGRSGRQGDPGNSQFFVALDDDIMRIFGGEQIAKIMDFLKIDENQPIEHSMVSKSIESAQVKVEGFFFDQRKRLVEFDDVMNKQREIIYRRRRRLLEQAVNLETEVVASPLADGSLKASKDIEEVTLKEQIMAYIRADVESLVQLRAPEKFTIDEYDAIVKEFIKIIPFDDVSQKRLRGQLSKIDTASEIIDELMKIVEKIYQSREKILSSNMMREIEKVVMLSTLDEKWMDHLDEMDNLRDGIWLRGDKQTVLSEYKKEAFATFERLINSMESTVASRIFRVHPAEQPITPMTTKQAIFQKDDINESLDKEVADATPAARQNAPQKTSGSIADLASALSSAKAGAKADPGIKKVKIGRNDLCPCGSGKKYKKCGLINAPEHQT